MSFVDNTQFAEGCYPSSSFYPCSSFSPTPSFFKKEGVDRKGWGVNGRRERITPICKLCIINKWHMKAKILLMAKNATLIWISFENSIWGLFLIRKSIVTKLICYKLQKFILWKCFLKISQSPSSNIFLHLHLGFAAPKIGNILNKLPPHKTDRVSLTSRD